MNRLLRLFFAHRRAYFIALAVLVVGAHVALLLGDRIPDAEAWRLIRTNAMIWAVLILPIPLLALYIKARRRDED